MSIYLIDKKNNTDVISILRDMAQNFRYRYKRKHDIYIMTCYINLEKIKYLIDIISDELKIENVYLQFDYSEVWSHGIDVFCKYIKNLIDYYSIIDINFVVYCQSSQSLMHAKSYAIIQKRGDEVDSGIVLITSANATYHGITGRNIEIGYVANDIEDVNIYLNIFNDLNKRNYVDIFDNNAKHYAYLFKFMLLSSGVFIHKWSGSLAQSVGIKYDVTDSLRQSGGIKIPYELERAGFKTGDTFTRQILNLDKLPERMISRAFISKFTIETYWGRWCPKAAWDIATKDGSESDLFFSKFKEMTTKEKLLKIKLEASDTQSDLISSGYIEEVSEDHLDNWISRINDLREDVRKLDKFFCGYSAHPLPYRVEQKSEIKDLFDNLLESSNSAKKKSLIKNQVIAVCKTKKLNKIHISREDVLISLREKEDNSID